LDSDSQRGAINKGKGGNINVAPEDRVAPSDQEGAEEAFDEDENEPSYPSRVNVTIEKPGKGAVHVETIAQDGLIQIENVSYFAKSDLANAQTAEKEWSRQSLYAGPPFGNLDEELQVLLERYLDERGIDTALATFIPDYIDFKEQREYVGWLSSKLNPNTLVDEFSLTNLSRPQEIHRRLNDDKFQLPYRRSLAVRLKRKPDQQYQVPSLHGLVSYFCDYISLSSLCSWENTCMMESCVWGVDLRSLCPQDGFVCNIEV
jgi:hypothetical protein